MATPSITHAILKYMDLKPLRRAWTFIENGPVCVVMHQGAHIVEGPEDRIDDWNPEEPRESVLRLFIDYEDAIRYVTVQTEVLAAEEGELTVLQVTLDHLFKLLPALQRRAVAENDAPLRIDVCTIKDQKFDAYLVLDEVNVTDTLHSSFAAVN